MGPVATNFGWDVMAAAKVDIERLKAGGVTEFQIDTEFMAWFEQ